MRVEKKSSIPPSPVSKEDRNLSITERSLRCWSEKEHAYALVVYCFVFFSIINAQVATTDEFNRRRREKKKSSSNHFVVLSFHQRDCFSLLASIVFLANVGVAIKRRIEKVGGVATVNKNRERGKKPLQCQGRLELARQLPRDTIYGRCISDVATGRRRRRRRKNIECKSQS